MGHLSNHGRDSLDEVVLHVALQVKEGELVASGDLEKGSELGIGVDDAAVGLVLQVVGDNVGVDLLAHIGSGHLGASVLAQEHSELVTDAGRLDETGGLAVAGRALGVLALGLLGELLLAGNTLAENLEIGLQGGEDGADLLDLGVNLSELHLGGNDLHLGDNGLGGGGGDDGSNHGSHRGNLNGGLGLGSLLGGLLLNNGRRGNGSGSNNGGGRNGLSTANHGGRLLYSIISVFFK